MSPLFMDIVIYAMVLLVTLPILKRVLTAASTKRKILGLIKEGAVIIDVRSPSEFSSGHAAGSRNIPLADLEHSAMDVDPSRWIIVCCASGMRSEKARRWLISHGFPNVLNGGSWRNLP